MSLESTAQLREIFETQVAILHDRSARTELDQDDIRKLETLTRAWKTFNTTDVKIESADDKFAEMTVEQLLALATSED